VLYAIVGYKEGDEFPYEDVRSWQIKGDWLILNRSRHEHILVPAEAVTSVEIREDKDYEEVGHD
jgi:hypothetical protein